MGINLVEHLKKSPQYLERFFEVTNDVASDFATHAAPWLIDVPMAYLAGSNVVRYLGWPVAVGYSAGIGTELIGLSAARLALRLREYNNTRPDGIPPAPTGLATGMNVLYFAGGFALAALGGFQNQGDYTRMIFPVLSIVGTITHALYLDHKQRLVDNKAKRAKAEHQEELAQRRAERQAAKAQPITQPAQPVDNRVAILDILRNNGHATQAAIAQQVGITPQAVSKRLSKLEKEGVIADGNGSGWKVLA